ncbi:MAG TPA: hypothetical protein VLU46_06740 [Thermoanaerobaculia bacterium]|nr:hypothetical protein [Thermoanaerobaculia bacterium]
MSVAPAAGDYFLEIESHFAMRRGTPFILSAKDWSLMKSWFDEGVPLAIVIEAIDSVFSNNETSGRRKVISSLSYCRHGVKELWRDRKDLYAGSGDAAPEENVGALLQSLAADVERVSVETAAEIRALVAEKSVPRVEERLIEVEHALIQRLLALLSDPERREIEAQPASIIADVDEKTRQRTQEANLRRRIREKFELPRLTLFR